jgi:hypothetical protein
MACQRPRLVRALAPMRYIVDQHAAGSSVSCLASVRFPTNCEIHMPQKSRAEPAGAHRTISG